GLIARTEAEGLDSFGRMEARVLRVRPDGKLDLSLRDTLKGRINADSEKLEELLMNAGGKLPLNDSSTPEEIKELTGMSKKAFKKAVGHLLKARKIENNADGIRIAQVKKKYVNYRVQSKKE
ncbi:MAG: hypothetical protein IJU50_08935, partial [Lachnospiraceae bacterium]|nr:hypothetical protein [Lachnospiraceae bacterium]